MSQDATKIFREQGTITIGGTDVGYTTEQSGGVRLRVQSNLIPIRANELGNTVLKMVEGGVTVTARINMAQKDANTFEAAFAPWHSAGTTTINTTSAVPGTFAPEVAFVFTGQHHTITAGKAIVRVADEELVHALAEENMIPLMVQFVPDTGDSNKIVTITTN